MLIILLCVPYSCGYMSVHTTGMYLLLITICLVLVHALCQGNGLFISLSQIAMDQATDVSRVSAYCWQELRQLFTGSCM